ncbi:MAG: S-adenosylmethionine:tRNA ribosyltransferase-isomerase, partial [Myxococcota bacterium]
HAAGISATGDRELDARLPLPERYEIPVDTAASVRSARRVVAVGTSVVRALEGSLAERGAVVPGRGQTELVIGDGFRPRVVTGLLSGVHEPQTSHHDVLAAFAPARALALADAHAVANGYRIHEFGDSTLILPGALGAVIARSA